MRLTLQDTASHGRKILTGAILPEPIFFAIRLLRNLFPERPEPNNSGKNPLKTAQNPLKKNIASLPQDV